jgi:hypothetical protein
MFKCKTLLEVNKRNVRTKIRVYLDNMLELFVHWLHFNVTHGKRNWFSVRQFSFKSRNRRDKELVSANKMKNKKLKIKSRENVTYPSLQSTNSKWPTGQIIKFVVDPFSMLNYLLLDSIHCLFCLCKHCTSLLYLFVSKRRWYFLSLWQNALRFMRILGVNSVCWNKIVELLLSWKKLPSHSSKR